MNHLIQCIGFAGIVCLTIGSKTAAAEHHMSAFSNANGFQQLLTRQFADTRQSTNPRALQRMDYADANNLCVRLVLQGDAQTAATTCAAALKKLDSATLRSHSRRKAGADIYSNLAVAQMLSGNPALAQAALTKAIAMDASHSNARKNQGAYRASGLIASN